MTPPRDTWTRTHDLALVYVAVAYGADSDLADSEISVITEALHRWREDLSVQEVREMVIEAMAVFLEGEATTEVPASMHSLGNELSDAERQRALEDIVHIAEADGVLLTSERSFVSVMARTWGLKELGEDLLMRSRAESKEDVPEWTLFHDLGLIYVVMAHSTDNDLSSGEIEAIIERLRDWREGMTDEAVRDIVRTALAVYGQQPDEALLQASVGSIRQHLPIIQRLAALDDLIYIAEIDGPVNEYEREMIRSLAEAWQLGIRLNGRLSLTPRS
ncbi:MAG: TerB family tellurite resistance protein [Bacteroidota bacterium]